MAFREKIELLIDVVTTGARSQLQNLKRDVDGADDAFGKVKAGAAGVFGGLGNVVAGGVSAAGAAIGAFALKAIGDFQQVALQSGEMSTKLGLSVEDASRLKEVSEDLGIEVGTLESAIGRMNRTAETSPGKFDDIGASIARNKDGTIDVTQTFKNAAEAVDRIPDAAERAKAAQEIFGKGWMGIATLIEGGASGITEAMKSVEDAKVIDEEEVDKARRFRDVMDSLKGKFESFSLAAGEALVEMIANFERGIEVARGFGDEVLRWVTLRDARQLIYDNIVAPLKDADEVTATYNETASLLTQGIKDVMLAASLNSLRDMGDDARGAATGFAELGDFVDHSFDSFEQKQQYLGAVLDALNSTDWGRAAFDGAKGAMDGYSTKLFELGDFVQGKESAWREFADAVKESGVNFDVATEAGGRQQDALRGIAEYIDSELASAYDNADGSMLTFKGSAENIANTLRDRLQQELGLSTEDTEELIRQLGLTPTDVRTRYQLAGDEEARIKIGLLQGAIEALPKNTRLEVQNQIINGDYQGAIRTIQEFNNRNAPTVDVNAVPGDVAGGRNAIQQYNDRNPTTVRVTPTGDIIGSIGGKKAGGGTTWIGETSTLVGETGPEIAELPPGTKVHRASETRRMLNEASAGPLVSVGQIVVQNGEDMEEHLTRLAWSARMRSRPVPRAS